MAHSTATKTGHFHAVQFYCDDDSLVAVVARFLAEGFAQNEPGIVIATPQHARGIEEALARSHHDVKRMKQLGDLVVLDARETLDTLTADGVPHPELFEHVIGRLLDETSRIHPDRSPRAFGEMVDLLWKDGHTTAAVRLESLWNGLVRTHNFKLLCGYSTDNLYTDGTVGAITRQHSHLMVDDGEAATIN